MDIKNPCAEDTAAGADTAEAIRAPHHNKIRPNTKLFSVLAFLARGRSLNRFEATRECRDWLEPTERMKAARLLGWRP